MLPHLHSESRTILTAPEIVIGNNSQKTLKQGQLLKEDVSQKYTAKPERPLHYKLYYTTLGERIQYSNTNLGALYISNPAINMKYK